MGGIEDQIFQNIESGSGETFADGDTYDPSQDEPSTRRGERNQPEADHELDQVDNQLRSRERRSNLEEDDNRQKPPRDQRQKPDQRRRDADQQEQTDEYGNTVGSKSFYVTRRLKSQLDNQRSVNTSLREQTERLTRQLAETQVLGDAPKRYGMNAEETADFLAMGHQLKSNPVEGARKVIEYALAKGANLKDIVNDEFIPNVTLNATRALLDERLGPIAQERQQQQDVDTDTNAATVEARQFMADYPEAVMHQEVIADQMNKIEAEYAQRGLKVSKYVIAEKAYNRLEVYCEKNGLDINQPLAPQLQARQRQAPSGDRNNPRSRQSPRPMPNGSGGGSELSSRKNSQANADDSYSSIVRESMREAGYQL